MTTVTDLVENFDAVIGVDTHVDTHSAALLNPVTGGVLDEITVEASEAGYAELVEFADQHAVLRLWAIEGTGSHGAGLARHLATREEVMVELDRPARAKRRHGAKSDPLDAIRAAREALARPHVGVPRSSGGDRQSLAVLLAARRSAAKAPATPNDNSSPSSSQHPKRSGTDSAAKPQPPWSRPPSTSAPDKTGTSKPPPPSPSCAPWPAEHAT